MENVLKGIHLLKGMDQKTLKEIEKDAFTMWLEFRVTFKVFKVTDKDVTIGCTQMKTQDFNYKTQKELITITHHAFDRHFPGRKVQVHATIYQDSPAQKIDPAWIKKKMEDYGIPLKTIAADTGLDNTQLSPLITGSKPLSDAMKAMFYFYFKSKEN